jgi:hydrogenase maturation protease
MKTLVIGYGNTLRGDDGIGFLVAEQVAAWNLPEVRSLSVHQLTPELAAEIAQAEVVYFADACVGRSQTSIEPIEPVEITSRIDHLWSPSVLLHLAKKLYDADPVAYQILIPAIQFDYGTVVSVIANDGSAWSLKTLKDLLSNSRLTPLCTNPLEKIENSAFDPPIPLKKGASEIKVPLFKGDLGGLKVSNGITDTAPIYTIDRLVGRSFHA